MSLSARLWPGWIAVGEVIQIPCERRLRFFYSFDAIHRLLQLLLLIPWMTRFAREFLCWVSDLRTM